jgi:hypothetical protein
MIEDSIPLKAKMEKGKTLIVNGCPEVVQPIKKATR